MTTSPNTYHPAIHKLLREQRMIALLWSTEDILEVRPDLNDDQAWEVLQACQARHDCTCGLSWEFMEAVAEDLFPAPDSTLERG